MKAKGPAAAKEEKEKKKGLELFEPRPPTPQMLRAFGRFNRKVFIEKLKVEKSTQVFFFVVFLEVFFMKRHVTGIKRNGSETVE